MIVCDALVFLHLHKSGGTFVNELLLKCELSAQRIGYHLPYRELPAEHRAKPVTGTVRNPYEYYVSWYAFQRSQKQPNALFRLCSDENSRDFAGTITALLALESDEMLLARLRESLPDQFQSFGLNLTKSCVLPLAGSGLGFYSFLHNRLYAGADAPRILRTERIRADLLPLLSDLGCIGLERMDLFLRHVPALNRSDHADYRDYYTADLTRLVARADAPLLDRYDFD